LLRFFHSTPPGLWKEEPIPLPVHPLRDLFNRAKWVQVGYGTMGRVEGLN
jgi:hypothetical protein